MKIELKPLSINCAFQGRRFKTPAHREYETQLLWLLKGHPKYKGWYDIRFDFYLRSYKVSDLSNLIKITEDCLVKAGIVEDDRFCKLMTVAKHPSRKDYFTFVINGGQNGQRRKSIR